jgi:hypothetical protein
VFWEGVYCGLRKDRHIRGTCIQRSLQNWSTATGRDLLVYVAKVIVCSKTCSELKVFGRL